MKIGIGDYYINRLGTEKGAERMAELGITCLDLNLADTDSEYYKAKDDDFIDRLLTLKRSLAAHNIRVYQVHGPWRYPPKDFSDEERAERFEKMTKSLVAARHLGAKFVALHPLMPCGINPDTDPEKTMEINLSYYSALANVAASLGVIICLENMPFPDFSISTPAEVAELVRRLGHPNVKMCFDVGHANLFPTPIGQAIAEVGDLIAIIHVHDNDGTADSHLIPYSGSVDWGQVIEALYSVGYEGVFNLECAPSGDTPEALTASEGEMIKYSRLLSDSLDRI